MLEPKNIELNGKTYILSKFPAWSGTLLMSRLPVSMLPKIGDFGVFTECLAEVLSYVCVTMPAGEPLALKSPEIIDNHVKDWETNLLLFKAMVEYNSSFLQNGSLSNLLNGITANSLPDLLARTYQVFSQLSSAAEKQA